MTRAHSDSLQPVKEKFYQKEQNTNLFYVGSACLFVVLMVLGFQHFYFSGKAYPGREIPPPLKTLVIVHAISMTAWVLIFLTQAILMLRQKYGTHRWLGQIAAVFAVTLLISGVMVSIKSTSVAPPDAVIWSMTPRQFMAVPFLSILIFSAMVGFAIWKRRQPEIHRPMMLFATLGALTAATSRITFFSELYVGTTWETVFGPFLAGMSVGGLLVIVRLLQSRRSEKWFLGSYVIVLVGFLLIVQIARTDLWVRFADTLVG